MSKTYDLTAAFAYLAAPAQKALLAAASSDVTRYNLNGVYVDVDASKLVATDGARLHLQSIADAPADLLSLPGSLVLPREAWEMRKDLIARDASHYSPVTLEISDNAGSAPEYRWTLTCGPRTYSFRQAALQFPAWQAVMPRNTSEFALQPPKTKLPEGKNDVVELSFDGGSASFRPKSDGSANTCFNAAYVKDALKHVGSKPTAHYCVDEGLHPLRLVGPVGEAIIMPMRR
jgi:DNA polymerase III sliding clamp (beta) subunit (PCNA family)